MTRLTLKSPRTRQKPRRHDSRSIRTRFDDGDVRLCGDRELRVLSVIRKIPRGRVCTYGKITDAAGLPRRARLVGMILHRSPLAEGVPWHRVVNASGRLSERPGAGTVRQRDRLLAEGVTFSTSGRIDLSTVLWVPPT